MPHKRQARKAIKCHLFGCQEEATCWVQYTHVDGTIKREPMCNRCARQVTQDPAPKYILPWTVAL